MKVLSGHVVTKSQAEDSMELLIMPALAVDLISGPPQVQQPSDSNLNSPSQRENINRRRWKRLFRGVRKKPMDCEFARPPPKKLLFGRPLSDLCEKDGSLPKPIMDILLVLWRRGPNTEGVFRKTGNAKHHKEIKEQLNNGVKVYLKDEPVILLAGLLKEFLRLLPSSLLMVELYEAWMTAKEKLKKHDMCTELQLLIEKLPGPNFQLLKHLMAVLHHISLEKETNLMDSNNLAICVSPNLLQSDKVEMTNNVSDLTKFFIDNCCAIFGEDVLTLFGDLDEDELSDCQDSLSSTHHDSAYESTDPDTEGYKGSYTDMCAIKSNAEEKNHLQAFPCSGDVGRNTTKPFIRRCSEPSIGLNKGVQNKTLTRSQTQISFYDLHLTKQISNECVLFRTSKVLNMHENTSVLTGELQNNPKDISCCSSSSLESTFSSASESSIHTSSPIVSFQQRRVLQRKQSFPTRLTAYGSMFSDTTKKRSQSMKASSSRTKANFSKHAEKALRHSKTLPEVLPFDLTLHAPLKPCRFSSEEVFNQVDSRIPNEPPSYEQAIQDNGHMPLSHPSSLTVDAARCLSKSTCCQSTFPTAETAEHSCPVQDCSDSPSCHSGETSFILCAASTTPQPLHCSQQMLDTLNVRESYV